MTEANAPTPVCKVRLRFSKADDLRFLSHHDLMRLLERLLRRANLPFRSTGGFHPKPKITFASALSLGIAGRLEVVEIEFDGDLDPGRVLSELQVLAPAGLTFLTAKSVPPKKTAQPVRAVYFFPLPPDARPDLAAKIEELLAQPTLVISRTRTVPLRPAQEEPLAEERLDALTSAEPVQTKVELKRLDLKPFLRRLWRDEQGFWMDVHITNQGAARPEELLRLVDLEESWLDGEAILERVVLEIEDEVDPHQSPDRKGGVQVQSLGTVAGSPLTHVRGCESGPLFPKGKSVLPPLSCSQALPGNQRQGTASADPRLLTPDSYDSPPVLNPAQR